MDQRLSMITLGVADVPAARSFYERLGWTVTVTDGDIVMFQAGSMIVSLWWRDKLDVDGGVSDRGGYGRAALAYAVAALTMACIPALAGSARAARRRPTGDPGGGRRRLLPSSYPTAARARSVAGTISLTAERSKGVGP